MEAQEISQGIITFAYGSAKYIEMAITLGRSLRLHANSIPCAVVTDSSDPRLSRLFDCIIPLNAEWGSNVRQKLYIDKYSPFERTLFIDVDSIVYRDLNFVFERFNQS